MPEQQDTVSTPTTEAAQATTEEVTEDGTQQEVDLNEDEQDGSSFDPGTIKPEDVIGNLMGLDKDGAEEKEVVDDTKQIVADAEPSAGISEADRLKDSQSMIGKQGNEIGELRKSNADLVAAVEALKGKVEGTSTTEKEVEEGIPYWEKILSQSDEEILAGSDKELDDPEQAKQNLHDLKSMIKLAKDMVAHEIKPLVEMKTQVDQQSENQKEITTFKKSHPELDNRVEQMDALADKVYPNGIPKGMSDLAFADVMYNLVGALPAQQNDVQKNAVDEMTNKKILSTRNLNGAVTSTPTPVNKTKVKLNPIQQELSRAIPGLYPGG